MGKVSASCRNSSQISGDHFILAGLTSTLLLIEVSCTGFSGPSYSLMLTSNELVGSSSSLIVSLSTTLITDVDVLAKSLSFSANLATSSSVNLGVDTFSSTYPILFTTASIES